MVANGGVATVCPEKKRVTSSDLANLVYFKCGDGLGQFAVYATSGGLATPTNGFRFVGFRFGVSTALAQVSHLVQLGSGDGAVQNKPSQLGSNMGLDRCWFDGHPGCDIRHCVEFHCKYFYAVDCGTGPDIHVQFNSESHVFCGYNGPGPGRLVNNLITGGTQYIFFGGAASPCGTPSDIEVRFNYCTRPASWVTSPWHDKCGIEAKKWAYSIIEGNIIENVRLESQIGAAFLLKSENYDSVQPTTTDLLVRYNLVRNVAHALTFAGVANGPLAPAVRIISYSNLYLVGAPGYYNEPNSVIGPYYSTDSGCIHDTFVCEQSQNAIGQPPQGAGGPTNLDPPRLHLRRDDDLRVEARLGRRGCGWTDQPRRHEERIPGAELDGLPVGELLPRESGRHPVHQHGDEGLLAVGDGADGWWHGHAGGDVAPHRGAALGRELRA
jgi:hypothetical protein